MLGVRHAERKRAAHHVVEARKRGQDARVLDKRAQPSARGARRLSFAEQGNRTRRGRLETRDHFHGRRFAGAVATDETVDFAAAHRQVKPVDGSLASVGH